MVDESVTDFGQEVIKTLAYAIQRGERSLDSVPGLLRKVIDENLWQERTIGDNQHITLKEFRRFVTAEYPEGLGTTIEILKALCADDDDLTDYLERARVDGIPALKPMSSTGRARTSDMSEVSKTGGNSADYILALLKRDAPDLAEQVISKEISAAEGKRLLKERQGVPRPNKIPVNVADVEAVAKVIQHYFNADQISELLEYLAPDYIATPSNSTDENNS